MKYFSLFFLVLSTSLFGKVEDSIAPQMDYFEQIEHLDRAKYGKSQFIEIECLLKHKCERLRVMTYNMLFDLYDHNLSPENRWNERLPRLVELINEIKPDLIGTQEIMPTQLPELKKALLPHYIFCGESQDETSGFFVKNERLRISCCQTILTGDDGDTATLVTLQDQVTGKTFYALNTHFAFKNIDKRDAQARQIGEIIQALEGEPVLFMGDLNTFPQRLDLSKLPAYDGDYICRLLKRSGLQSSADTALLGHLGPISTFTNLSQDDVKPFKGTGVPGIILDHIFVTPPITVWLHAVEPAKVNGHFPSDHMPVLVDFTIN